MIRLNQLWLLASLGTLNILSAAERNPIEDRNRRDTISIEVNGQLQTGVMAIGAETTGTTITANDIRFDIDWGGQKALASRAEKLDRNQVRVTGSLRQQTGPERGRRLIIEATNLENLSVKDPEMDDKQKMSFRLDQMKWDKRPFLIFASDQDASTYEQQIAALKGLKPGLSARDMSIISVFGNGRATVDGKEIDQESIQRLRSEFQVPTDQFRVILVGKDGTEKLRRKTPVALREIFALIDSMPMRQREMRQDDSR